MNHISQLAADLESSQAEARALRAGLAALLDYVSSDKFGPSRSDLAGYVNVTDIVLRIRETTWAASLAENDAYYNAVGPAPADGGHTYGRLARTCSHGRTDRAGDRIVNGYHCPECGDAMPAYVSDAASAEAMRLHWIAAHKQNVGAL